MYDYIIEKPPLNEDTLTHFGIKGMKWRKRKAKLKSGYYSTKSKVGEKVTKFKRSVAGLDPEDISRQNKYGFIKPKVTENWNITDTSTGKVITSGSRSNYDNSRDNGKADSHSGRKGSNVEAGIAAGRERAKKRKKK